MLPFKHLSHARSFKNSFRFVSLLLALVPASVFAAERVTLYRDVAPILQKHCVRCHQAGGIAPMSLQTYQQARPFAAAIREQTKLQIMPPWFAAAAPGTFANDPSLSDREIETLSAWAQEGARAELPTGKTAGSSSAVFPSSWQIGRPDIVFQMPQSVALPATGDVDYTYVIIPTHFAQDRWVQMSEIRPGNRAVVHHAVAYIREPSSSWLRSAPVGKPFTAGDLVAASDKHDASWTTSDILLVYAPGSSPDQWPSGYGKLVPAGADIVLQMHYTSRGKPENDRTSIGLRFLDGPPVKRVLTLQLTNDRFLIPPGDPDHHVEVHGSIPNDALLLSFFPHMHLRGKSFEYRVRQANEPSRTILQIPHYDFFWQLSYRLANPLPLHAGDTLEAIASFDNSKNNPHNPDPDEAVTWGEQTSSEMMVGFFDVAVDPTTDKNQFFIRKDQQHLHPSPIARR